MKQAIAAFICLLLVSACADTHQLIRQEGVQTIRFNPSDSIYVSVPQDGAYGEKTYRGSGQTTTQIVMAAFERRSRTVRNGRVNQSFDEALEAAKNSNCNWLVYPSILQWEDRTTEWSGIPDRVEINIEVVDVASGNTATYAIVKGKSGLATFGSDHPQGLLPQPVEEFVSSLY